MQSLRVEADEATAKVEELKKQVKALEHENLQKEQEITSLQHKNGLLDAQVEKLEAEKKDLKATAGDSHQHATQNETLQRRLQLLEEEAEEADKNLRETNDKYVTITCLQVMSDSGTNLYRLRQTDVKAGHFERKVQALEQERDQWEAKYEEVSKKYATSQKELEDFQAEVNAM